MTLLFKQAEPNPNLSDIPAGLYYFLWRVPGKEPKLVEGLVSGSGRFSILTTDGSGEIRDDYTVQSAWSYMVVAYSILPKPVIVPNYARNL